MNDFLLWQINVNLFLQLLPEWMISFFILVTNLGDELFYLLFMPFLYWCIDGAIGLRVGAMLLFSNATVSAAKLILQWPRPYWIDTALTSYAEETSFGIPSGHATNAASVWGVLAASVKRRWFSILTLVLIFLIGFSRIVLGTHFLIDVLAGWILGTVILVIFLRLEKPVVRWFNRLVLRQQIFVAVFSSLMLILPSLFMIWVLGDWVLPEEWQNYAGHEINPLSLEGVFTVGGTWGGFLSGFAWISSRLGKYDAQGRIVLRFTRYLIGISGVILLWIMLDRIFPDNLDMLSLTFRYIRYFAIGLWISAGAPFIFQKFKLVTFTNSVTHSKSISEQT